jgi:hypothetical protein
MLQLQIRISCSQYLRLGALLHGSQSVTAVRPDGNVALAPLFAQLSRFPIDRSVNAPLLPVLARRREHDRTPAMTTV